MVGKNFPRKRIKKKARFAVLTSDKIDFKVKLIRRDKRLFILIKESINQEKITTLNAYALNSNVSYFIKTY